MAGLGIVDTARVDTLYSDLARGLGAKAEIVIGHNTRLVRLADEGAIALRLHQSDVVVIYADGTIIFDTCGYCTLTTIERINHVARKLGWRAYRQGGQAYLGTRLSDGLHSVPLEGATYRAA